MPPSATAMPVLVDAKPASSNMETLFAVIEERDRRYDERDRRYEERFRAQEIAIAAALTSQQKAVADALVAQEKLNVVVQQASEQAISKAETAQQGVNERGNEFRKSLDDYTKLMVPRTETALLFDSVNKALEESRRDRVSIREEFRKENGLIREEVRKEIQSLRESRAAIEGITSAQRSSQQMGQWIIGIVLGAIGLLSGILFNILSR